MAQIKVKAPTVSELKKELAKKLVSIKPSVTEKMIEKAADKCGISTYAVKEYLKGKVGFVQRGERIFSALQKEIEKGMAAA